MFDDVLNWISKLAKFTGDWNICRNKMNQNANIKWNSDSVFGIRYAVLINSISRHLFSIWINLQILVGMQQAWISRLIIEYVMISKAHDSCKTQHRMDLIFHAFQIIIDIVRRQIRGAKWQMSWNRKHLYSKPSITTRNECKVLYSYGCISVLQLSITFLPAYHRTENTNGKHQRKGQTCICPEKKSLQKWHF